MTDVELNERLITINKRLEVLQKANENFFKKYKEFNVQLSKSTDELVAEKKKLQMTSKGENK